MLQTGPKRPKNTKKRCCKLAGSKDPPASEIVTADHPKKRCYSPSKAPKSILLLQQRFWLKKAPFRPKNVAATNKSQNRAQNQPRPRPASSFTQTRCGSGVWLKSPKRDPKNVAAPSQSQNRPFYGRPLPIDPDTHPILKPKTGQKKPPIPKPSKIGCGSRIQVETPTTPHFSGFYLL